jgi:16S rRNA (uracil1498-N3)-methyltransferase
VERGTSSAVATFYVDSPFVAHARVDLGEGAAQHARVRRLQPGDAVRLTNGRGALGIGRIDRVGKDALSVSLEEVSEVPPLPRLRLFVPVADRDRMLWLAEKCAELAVSVWQPVYFRRSASVSPRGEGEAFARKVRARMVGALEQSGGAWLPELCPALSLPDALVRSENGEAERFLLDRGGAPLVLVRAGAADAMLGPEGGIEPEERALILDKHGWVPVSLGDTTLRFETAGIVAAGILRALLLRG